MSNYLKEFEFKKQPEKFSFTDEDPLNITEEFVFYHSKSKMRKALNQLQYLFKSYTKNPLLALGIRDSFLSDEYADEFLIVLFTVPEGVEQINKIIQENSEIHIKDGCFYIRVSSTYLLLLARDIEGVSAGINTVVDLMTQVLDHYFDKKGFEDFIKIRTCKINGC
ncbi:MAG: hypothetical protein ACW986_12290 [Promethearchaeota archaeon]|jgi:hypothetical protein